MNPEERRQLLEERTKTAELLSFSGREEPDSEVEREKRERQRLEDIAAVEAFRQKPQSVGDILKTNIDICRQALDPRVLLEAAEIGMSDSELEQMRTRMKRWTDAVMLRPDDETHKERKKRLQVLSDELCKMRPRPGCGCDGKGWLLTFGTMHVEDGGVERDAEFYRLCCCDRGLAKLDEVKNMGKPRNEARGRGRKPDDKAEPVPF